MKIRLGFNYTDSHDRALVDLLSKLPGRVQNRYSGQ